MIIAIGPACTRPEGKVSFFGIKMLFVCELISAHGGLFLEVGFLQVTLGCAGFEVWAM